MEKVRTERRGRFMLRSHGRPTSDGKYESVFTVTERKGGTDEDTKEYTGQMFDTEAEAEEAGMKAAIAWLDKRWPVKG